MYPSSILTDCIREDGEYRHLLREIFEAGKRDSDPLPLLVSGLSEGATDALTVSLVEDTQVRCARVGTPCAVLIFLAISSV